MGLFIDYNRDLGFSNRPNSENIFQKQPQYTFLKQFIKNKMNELNYLYDYKFDWIG